MPDAAALDAAIIELRNKAGRLVVTEPDAVAMPVAVAPPGRVVVAPEQAIDPTVWGNVVYDQTTQVFANSAERTAQWPTPNEGATSWLADTHTPWIFRAGQWRPVGLGPVASALGPTVAFASGYQSQGQHVMVQLEVPAYPGRRYRCRFDGVCQNGTTGNPSLGTGQASLGLMVVPMETGPSQAVWMAYGYGLPPQAYLVGSGEITTIVRAPGTVRATVWVGHNLIPGWGAGDIRVAANTVSLMIEDIGG